MSEIIDYRDRPDLPSHLTVGELRVVHHYIERLADRIFLAVIDEEAEVSIIVRDRGRDGRAAKALWIEFTVAGRPFAIWRETMALYEVGADGAMADDPIEVV